MDNVHCLTTRRSEAVKSAPKVSDADAYMGDFYDWAMANGIDTTTTEFKFNAATVLTVVQSLLHSRG
jgi:hypothetical protein